MNVPYNILREKCPNTELFLVRIFPHSGWIRRDTKWNVSYWFTANLIQLAWWYLLHTAWKLSENGYFLVCIFLYSDQKKLLIGTLFTQWQHKMLMKTGLKQCPKIYLSFSQIRLWFKINDRNTRTIFKICLNLTIKTPERL